MNADERKTVRTLFKTVVLGIQYGLGARSLSYPRWHLAATRRVKSWRGYGRGFIGLRITHPWRSRSCRIASRNRDAVRLAYAMSIRHQPAHGSKFPDPIHPQQNSPRRRRPRRAARVRAGRTDP